MKKIFIEYDNFKLKELSTKMDNLFKERFNTTILDNNISVNEKLNVINNANDYFVLSNKIADDSNTVEIIYQLRSNDYLAKELVNALSNVVNVTKYYQLRSNINTANDYDKILNDTKKNDAIIIKYGENILSNSNIPLIIYQTIQNYFQESNLYTVVSGDSLYALAKRFNTTVDAIKKANNLSTNNLSIGQKLIIPNENTNIDNNQNTYTVVSGDSLYALAKRFNTTVDAIKKANNLSTNNLSIGQKLIIPSNDNQTIYTVVSGDSLYALAKRFNTTVDAIKKVNNLATNNLSIGQKLIIK